MPYGDVIADALRAVDVGLMPAEVRSVDSCHDAGDVVVADDAVTLQRVDQLDVASSGTKHLETFRSDEN